MSIWLNGWKNGAKSLSYVYKYIYQERGQLQKRLINLMSSVVINYRCRFNQDFTKAHLPKYKLLSECCPTRGVFTYRGSQTQMPHWEKHVCNDENTCSRMQMDILAKCQCRIAYVAGAWARWRAKMLRELPAATNTLFCNVYESIF